MEPRARSGRPRRACLRRLARVGTLLPNAARQEALPRLRIWYLLPTRSHECRLVPAAPRRRRLALALRFLALLLHHGGQERGLHIRQLGLLVRRSSGFTKCAVITTSSSSVDFCVLRLWNSLPRIGMLASPGTFSMVSITWLLSSPAMAKLSPSFSTTSVSARRCESAGMVKPSSVTALV